jgi:hypothetical protein
MSSPNSSLELHVNPHGKMHQLSLDTILILQQSSYDFDDVIREGLESYSTRCFPQNIIYHLSSHKVVHVKYGPEKSFLDNEELWF